MREIKDRIHRINNHLQGVLGYLELEDFDKSIDQFHKTIWEVAALGMDLSDKSTRKQLVGLDRIHGIKVIKKRKARKSA